MAQRVAAIFLLVLPLAGCVSLSISQPTRGQTVCGATNTLITWTSDLHGGFSVKQDGADVTPQFTVNSSARTASATITYPEGTHTLQASGTLQCWYCNGDIPLTTSINFQAVCRHK
jgi:hypothetical protein